MKIKIIKIKNQNQSHTRCQHKIFGLIKLLILISFFNLVGCGDKSDVVSSTNTSSVNSTANTKNTKSDISGEKNIVDESTQFSELEKLARNTTVTLYGWGGDPKVNDYFINKLGSALKEEYNIELKMVPMDPNEYLNKIATEKQTNSVGSADILWINGVNFKTAKDENLLYGPIDKLPNYKNIDLNDESLTTDFGTSVDFLEVPFGRAQFIFISRDDFAIKTAKQLFEYVKSNPGKFTYPNPNQFTGGAFLRTLIYNLNIDYRNLSSDKEKLRQQLKPLFHYLNDMKPYLWNSGKTYPTDVSALDYLFSNKSVDFTMNYNLFHAYAQVDLGIFPKTTKSFILDKGSTANTHFMAIPINSPNKAGAQVVINKMIGSRMQFKKYQPAIWGDLPVLDIEKLSEKNKQLFSGIDFGKNAIDLEALSAYAVPELNADLTVLITELWTEEVLRK